MSSTADTAVAHPVVDFTSRLHARLDGLAEVPAWSLSAGEARGVLVDLARGQARLEEVLLGPTGQEAAVAVDPSLDLAGEFDARALKHLARHVLEVLDPDAADLALGKRLDAEERAAARTLTLVEVHSPPGRVHLNQRGPATPSVSAPPPAREPAPGPVPAPGGRSAGRRYAEECGWSEGGPTNLPNGRLLCPHHHAKAHSPAYQSEPLPNGKIRFHRRT
jgi:hypothetical protein